jgi:hypothetical protein
MYTCCAVHDGTCMDDAHLGQSAHWTQCMSSCENYNIGSGGGGGCPMGMLCE